jgi:hypothetical protein
MKLDSAGIATLIQAVETAIAAAPGVVEVVEKGKDFLVSVFSAADVPKETQDRVFNHVEEVTAAFLAGNVPPEFTVEPDTTEPTPTPPNPPEAPV